MAERCSISAAAAVITAGGCSGAGAELVKCGIDPTLLFVARNFLRCKRYIRDLQVGVLPLGIEHLPRGLRFFDTVFSMGVLYHRRSPFDHLLEIRERAAPGRLQMVLESAGDLRR